METEMLIKTQSLLIKALKEKIVLLEKMINDRNILIEKLTN